MKNLIVIFGVFFQIAVITAFHCLFPDPHLIDSSAIDACLHEMTESTHSDFSYRIQMGRECHAACVYRALNLMTGDMLDHEKIHAFGTNTSHYLSESATYTETLLLDFDFNKFELEIQKTIPSVNQEGRDTCERARLFYLGSTYKFFVNYYTKMPCIEKLV